MTEGHDKLIEIIMELCSDNPSLFRIKLLPRLGDLHPGTLWQMAGVFAGGMQGYVADFIAA